MNWVLKNLKLKPLAIGSLPYKNPVQAMEVVEKYFRDIPFFPQLANVSIKEDMICQFLEGFPGFNPQNCENFILDLENEEFLANLETFFSDYEQIMNKNDYILLEKYGISKDFSSTFSYFENIIKNTHPSYGKCQITGPFTLATSINDINSKPVVFDETLRDIIVKFLSLKVLWEIKRIKSACEDTIPIIFMDEPSVSQIGTSAYISISENEVISMISEISNVIKSNGALSAIHCCGKCDWRIPIKSGVDIINFDAYTFFSNFGIYHNEIKTFLENNGKIAWGLVPTFDEDLLFSLTAQDLAQKFYKSINYLTNFGIDEKLVVDNSLITSSCGAGSLSERGALKAMSLIKELSDLLLRGEHFDY